jgi:hypothetical protein
MEVISINSYPKIWNLGNVMIKDLLLDQVIVQEKVDGSQFSFGIFNGELQAQSKKRQLDINNPEGMFSAAIETIKELSENLHPNWIYRSEYLMKPKHNVVKYDRIPDKGLIIYDINYGYEKYKDYDTVKNEADRIGLEYVPLFYKGIIEDKEKLKELLEPTSCLGGAKIEGIVLKNYLRNGRNGRVLMGKYVSEAFKEKHSRNRTRNGNQSSDIKKIICEQFKSEARWQKAMQHLRDDGKLENDLKDIGKLIKETIQDTIEECEDEIKELLWKWLKPEFTRKITNGLPEWYKEKLMNEQFEE